MDTINIIKWITESERSKFVLEYIAEIIIGFLAFIGTLVGSMLANNKSQAIMQEQIKGIKEDIGTLSARVDKHNNLVERMATVEARIDGITGKGAKS